MIPITNRNILEITDLRLSYHVRTGAILATNGLSLQIGQGESVGIVGESGSGKSTVARAIMGLLPERVARIESGKIVIDGRDVTHLKAHEWGTLRGNPIAMVFQDPLSSLNPIMRVGKQIAESVALHDKTPRTDERVEELLNLVKLPLSVVTAYPSELSGGMRQRALLAVALGCRPRLLIADEPTTALDVTTQQEILDLLRDLRQRLGMAMLLISHDLGIVSSECERIYVMYAGRVVEAGSAEAIFATPEHPYTVGLLRASRAEKNEQGRFQTINGDVPNLAKMGPECGFLLRCPYATDDCRMAPALSECAADMKHVVRCWHAESTRLEQEVV